jgi:hypothetical protein
MQKAAPVAAIEVEGDQVPTLAVVHQPVRLDRADVCRVTPVAVVQAPLVAALSGDHGLRSRLSSVLESVLWELQCLRIR